MMRSRGSRQLRAIAVFLVLAVVGVVAAGYVLVHQRLPKPFANTYNINVELTAANGVLPGLGQPVNVAGVQVGSIIGARLDNGNALITLQLQRSQVPHVYADADATLAPITPLGDVEIDLSPGRPPAPALRAGATLGVGQTSSPVPLSGLLASLDSDTRTFLSSLIVSLGQGTADQGSDIRRALSTLGPTVAQVHAITAALATRRAELADLVHNVAIMTRAASEDHQLASVVIAGDETLHSLASEDAPLEQSVSQLPATLNQTAATLTNVTTFADKLGPTLTALQPAVKRLPQTFATLQPFATTAAATLKDSVMPLATEAQPLLSALSPAVSGLTRTVPDLTDSFQVVNYLVNELAYNPSGKNQGYLFWFDWLAHNWNSLFSTEDAHGGIGRADVIVSCQQLTSLVSLGPILQLALGTADICP